MKNLCLVILLVLVACNSAATPTEMPTEVATEISAATAAPPTETATPVPPTQTPVPPTETAAPIPPSPTPVLPTATATPGVVIANFPAVGCCKGNSISSGLYRFPAWQGLPLLIDVSSGWRVMNEEFAQLFTLGRGSNSLGNPSELVVFSNVSGEGSAEELMAQLQKEPNITPLNETIAADLAGFTGLQQDFAVLPNPDFAGVPRDDIPAGVQYLDVIQQFFTPGFIWVSSTPETWLRFIVVNVNEAQLFVYLEAPPDNFDAFTADAGQMLQTLAVEEAQ